MTFKTLMLSLALVGALGMASTADAAKKASKSGSRSDYSVEQQKKFFAQALELCRKKYQGTFVRAKVDYKRRVFVCYHF
jgi:hypothetical protein